MIKRVVIIPYNIGSQSAKNLQEELSKQLNIPIIRVRKASTKYQPRWSDYVINWGCSKDWKFITTDTKVCHQYAVDKLKTFKTLSSYNDMNPMYQINIPNWTEDKNEALFWNDLIVCRGLLSGHSGQGITLAMPTDPIPDVPLYVKYKKKKNEYRVHIFDGEVIDITQKKKRKGAKFLDTKIRNHKNGWVYTRENIYIPDDLCNQAQLTMKAMGLKFGAVDIIWNEKEDKCYVLEVNTAPGLIGTTLTNYVNSFIKDIQNEI